MKKILSVFLALVMMMSVLMPTFSLSADAKIALEIDEGDHIDAQLSAESMVLDEKINDYQVFKSYLAGKLMSCESEIDISSYKIKTGDSVYLKACIYDDMVAAFHVNSYSYYKNSSGYITRLVMNYNMTKDEYLEQIAACDEIAESFIADIKNDSSLSEAEKALLVHDRIAQWCEYDYQNLLDDTIPECSYDMNGVFINRIAVCEGYSKAYKYILEKLGMTCYLCDSNQLVHEWNIVVIDGVRYHVDVTWDDPVWDIYGRVNHDNFLRSTQGIISTGHEATDFDTSPVSTTYDSYFWQNSETEFQYKNGIFYYYDTANKQLKKIDDGVTSTLLTVSDKWRPSATGYYSKSFVRLDSDNYGNYLFYSTPESVYKYDLDTNTSSVVYTPTMPGSYYCIYGFKAQEDYFYLNIYNNANLNADAYEYNIKYRYHEESAPTYTVELAAGEGIASVSGTGEYAAGESVTISAVVSDGYSWISWMNETDVFSSEIEYTFTMPAENLALTATAEVVSRFAPKEGSTTVIKDGKIYGLKTSMTEKQLKENFIDTNITDVTYTKAVKSAKFLGTGSTVTVKYKDGTVEEYVIIIFGDLDGNGLINYADVSLINLAVADSTTLNEDQTFAADIDGRRRVTASDAANLNVAAQGSGLNQVKPSVPVE